MKEKLLIIFGGKSVEHDISIITALQAMKNLPEKYDSIVVYIDRDGLWWTAENMEDISIYKNFSKLAKKKSQVSVLLGDRKILVKKGFKWVESAKFFAVLNCCHGNLGEDGSIQGVFKCCEVAQSSPQVTSSAICMDKAFMKDIFIANDIKTPKYVVLKNNDFDKEDLKIKLEFPVIVKPANLGSSIGISVCKNQEELKDAIELAFEFDDKIIVEKMVENLREFNCACFMFRDNYFPSNVNEVTNKKDIYTFEDKYLTTSTKNQEVSKKLEKKVQELTEKVYKIFDCEGVVRVDFLFDEKQNDLYVNEINAIPGSLAFYLYKDTKFEELLSVIINQSVENNNKRKNLIKNFESDALEIYRNSTHQMKK